MKVNNLFWNVFTNKFTNTKQKIQWAQILFSSLLKSGEWRRTDGCSASFSRLFGIWAKMFWPIGGILNCNVLNLWMISCLPVMKKGSSVFGMASKEPMHIHKNVYKYIKKICTNIFTKIFTSIFTSIFTKIFTKLYLSHISFFTPTTFAQLGQVWMWSWKSKYKIWK